MVIGHFEHFGTFRNVVGTKIDHKTTQNHDFNESRVHKSIQNNSMEKIKNLIFFDSYIRKPHGGSDGYRSLWTLWHVFMRLPELKVLINHGRNHDFLSNL